MTRKMALRAVWVIGGLFALQYATSAWEFIAHHTISFVHYEPATPLEIWTVRNLGLRLLAIAAGFFVSLATQSRPMLTMMFGVRLVADAGDLINSALTPGLPSFVLPGLGVFVTIELVCLATLLFDTRSTVRSAGAHSVRTRAG